MKISNKDTIFVNNKVINRVWKRVFDRVRGQIRGTVHDQVWHQVEIQSWNPIRDQVRAFISVYLYENFE